MMEVIVITLFICLIGSLVDSLCLALLYFEFTFANWSMLQCFSSCMSIYFQNDDMHSTDRVCFLHVLIMLKNFNPIIVL